MAEHGLRLFLDSADPDDWSDWLPTGIFFGVTTNPILLERAGLPCTLDQLRRLVDGAERAGAGEIHLQTWGDSLSDLLRRAEALAALSPKAVVKVPLSRSGLEVAARLRAAGVPTTLTALFSPEQVILAGALGAMYAAPYLGRIADRGLPGVATVAAMSAVLKATGSQTRLLVASIREAHQLSALAAQGVDTFTLGPAIAAALLANDATDEAIAAFERAAAGSA